MPSREEKLRRRRIAREIRDREEFESREICQRLADLEWYFVNTVIPGESDDPTHELEVQVLDSAGRAKAVERCGRSATSLQIAGESIPRAVLDAARRLTVGLGGQYVDIDGNLLSFQGARLAWPDPPSRDDAAQQVLESALRLHSTGVPGCRLRLRLLQSHYSGTSAAEKARSLLKEIGNDT
jgi:hypothetical protein